jgi:hypothetical protein
MTEKKKNKNKSKKKRKIWRVEPWKTREKNKSKYLPWKLHFGSSDGFYLCSNIQFED